MLCLSLVCEFLCANKEKLAVLKRRGVAVGRQIRDQEVAGSSLGRALRRKNSGQVSHTYVPLSPSSITWYRSKGGDTLRLGRWSGDALAMCHRLSGLSTYGLKGLRQGDEHPAYAQHWVRHLYLYLPR